jgi:hypothetical protein
MMKLEEFDNIIDARGYVAPLKRMMTPAMVISYLTRNNSISTLQNSADEFAKGFHFALLAGVPDFDIMSDNPIGRAQALLVLHLVSVNAVTQAFYDACYNYANTTSRPFEFVTEHSFHKAKGTINKTGVVVVNGYCTITTTADSETHNPQIYREIEFENGDKEHIRIAGFDSVSIAGLYRVQCPNFPALVIDDAYGVISQPVTSQA